MVFRHRLFYFVLVGVLVHRGGSLTPLLSRSPVAALQRSPTSSSTLKAASSTANEGSIEVTRSDGSAHRLAYRVARPMSLSSRSAAPIVALHGGPSIPSDYLYPLENVVPYRSIVFYDQLGCGKSDEPNDISLYSIEDSVRDLRVLLKKLGIRRFHLYGQSYGGMLAFEYMRSEASRASYEDKEESVECLSAVLSSAPNNIPELEEEFDRLTWELLSPPLDGSRMAEAEVGEMFRKTHQCRLPEMPKTLGDAYANAGTVWAGTTAISDYVARPPPEGASRMPSALIMRGEFDFVSEAMGESWKTSFNTNFIRLKTLKGCSHHGLYENGAMYGEIIDSFFAEYD